MKYCPNCKIELPATAKFCKTCGGVLAASRDLSRCPRCGLDVRPEWKFCKQCGSPLTTDLPTVVATGTISCANCGTANRTGARFCKSCGKPLGAIVATAAAGAAAPTPNLVTPTGLAEPPLPTAARPTRITEPAQVPTPAVVSLPGVACPKCGSHVPVGLKFCETCGTTLVPVEKRPPAIPTEALSTVKKKVLISAGIAVAVLLAAGAVWYFWGVQLTIISEPPAAQVYLDSQLIGKTSEADGALKLAHVRRGQHSLMVKHDGYAVWIQPVQLGLAEFRRSARATLAAESFTLTLVTIPPGCRVLLDGQEVGTTDATDGRLALTGVSKGKHSLAVQHEGLPDWAQEVSVDEAKEIRAELGVAAPQEQGSADYHLSRANRLFTDGQYQAAIAECDTALQTDPANRAAAELKAKIQKTMEILGVTGSDHTTRLEDFLQGTWTHRVSWPDGGTRDLVLTATRLPDGRLSFLYLQQYFSYNPVFDNYSIEREVLHLRFALKLYATGADSQHRISYTLTRSGNGLSGQFAPSWERPQEVTLTRIPERRARQLGKPPGP